MGRFASIGLVLGISGIAGAAAGATQLMQLFDGFAVDEAWRAPVVGAIVFAVLVIVLVPLGVAVDRTLAALRCYIESESRTHQAPVNTRPKWLRPIVHAFTDAIEAANEREHDLRNEVREGELRLHVKEVEQRQIEAVLDAMRDAVIVTDAFSEIVVVNQAAVEVFALESGGFLHKPIQSVLGDERLSQLVADTYETANFSDQRHVEHEIQPARGVGGVSRSYDVSLTCIENHKHEAAGVVTILHDLTREREISQMKSDFVSKASHELRTPLSSIRAYVEMLVDGEATDEESRSEFYRIIHNETERLGRLIDNMLNISRIEAGIVQIEREQVNTKELIGRAIDSLEPQAKEKDISLLPKLAEVDLTVEGDSDMLYQVVLNLVSNAVKYTPSGGRVTVSADSDNLTRTIVITVADTGLGIPPDALPKVFEKFYRVENYKRVAKGTGLGLSLCKHIVETVHHGQIGVESKLGMGSKFWASIPMRYEGSRAAA